MEPMSRPPYCHSGRSRSQDGVPRGSVRCSPGGHEAQPGAQDPGRGAAHLRPSSGGTQGWIYRPCEVMISSLTCGECTPQPRRREASLPHALRGSSPLPRPPQGRKSRPGWRAAGPLWLMRLEGKKQVSYGALATPRAFAGLRRCSASFEGCGLREEAEG